MSHFYDSPDWTSFCLGHPGGEDATLRLVKEAKLQPGGRILDLCCGVGESVRLLHSLGFQCVGVDRESVVTNARIKYPHLPFYVWAGGVLPFEDNYFDAVLCECSLSQLDDRDTVLGEIRRVLSGQGFFLLSDLYEGEKPEGYPGFERLWLGDGGQDLHHYAMDWLWQTGRPFPYGGKGMPGYFYAILKKSGGLDHGL